MNSDIKDYIDKKFAELEEKMEIETHRRIRELHEFIFATYFDEEQQRKVLERAEKTIEKLQHEKSKMGITGIEPDDKIN